ncbi:MAG: radical SAM protein, partial [Gemmataceae bacterium]|nr:radical SAM protein [Gemmataceae bacterium]
ERVLDADLAELRVEDAYAGSLALNPSLRDWRDVRPRSLSVLPIARACQARCAFCFSHSSVSEDQEQGRLSLDRLDAACAASRARGAERLVVTGGGEPTLLPHAKLLEVVRTGARHFPKVVLITNGAALGTATPQRRQEVLRDYHAAGLTVLALSRHSHDRNAEIMGLETHSERVAGTWADHRAELANLSLRWVCVLQKGGVEDERSLRDYLTWAAGTGVGEVCFKELYVAVGAESVYAGSGYNAWSSAHQVPLARVVEFLRNNGAEPVGALPWGSPVYRLRWRGHELTVAAYTEPSVFWERANGLCRSWNLMADGTCYANLETADSRVEWDAPTRSLHLLEVTR